MLCYAVYCGLRPRLATSLAWRLARRLARRWPVGTKVAHVSGEVARWPVDIAGGCTGVVARRWPHL